MSTAPVGTAQNRCRLLMRTDHKADSELHVESKGPGLAEGPGKEEPSWRTQGHSDLSAKTRLCVMPWRNINSEWTTALNIRPKTGAPGRHWRRESLLPRPDCAMCPSDLTPGWHSGYMETRVHTLACASYSSDPETRPSPEGRPLAAAGGTGQRH